MSTMTIEQRHALSARLRCQGMEKMRQRALEGTTPLVPAEDPLAAARGVAYGVGFSVVVVWLPVFVVVAK